MLIVIKESNNGKGRKVGATAISMDYTRSIEKRGAQLVFFAKEASSHWSVDYADAADSDAAYGVVVAAQEEGRGAVVLPSPAEAARLAQAVRGLPAGLGAWKRALGLYDRMQEGEGPGTGGEEDGEK